MFHLRSQVTQLPAALLFYTGRQLSRQQRSPGAGPGRIWKNVNMGKPGFPAKIQGLTPLPAGLTGKSGDDVRRDVQIGNMLSQVVRQLRKIRALAAPAHAPQYAVTPALHGQVQVRHKPWIIEHFREILTDIPGFQ